MGIEPMTNGLLDQRSTDWAMRPNHEIKNFKKLPQAGLEPATPRLEVWCSIHWATEAEYIPTSSDSLVVMTSALHAEGREFNPRSEYCFCFVVCFCWVFVVGFVFSLLPRAPVA